jgi:catalase
MKTKIKPMGILFMIAFSTFCTDRCAAQGQARSTPVRDPNDNPKLDIGLVDALNTRYGAHPGFRADHAKGIVVEGTFTPTREAAELSRSPIFAGATLPVTVRFSDASGLPGLQDAAEEANPHGMSVKFHLPNGVESDIVANSLKFFTVATGKDFRDLQLAAATSPPGGPKSPRRDLFRFSPQSCQGRLRLWRRSVRLPVGFDSGCACLHSPRHR